MEKSFNILGHSLDIRPQTTDVGSMDGLPIGRRQIVDAGQTLKDYKKGKSALEKRIVENEAWYKIRHWEYIRTQTKGAAEAKRPEPASAWLFNSIANKHADAMDNFPEPNVLPRERTDEQDAKELSSILPVVLERNEYEETYSDAWWGKLKHGTCAYGVFWDSGLEDGLGDISVKEIDLLNLFWEPGIRNIQDSRNVFVANMRDVEVLEQEYPELQGKLGGTTADVAQYAHDDTIDTSKKTIVVDWYYKIKRDGQTILHFAKFVGDTLLFASENDPQYVDGWYAHGQYPIVLDVLFPLSDMPGGFGYIDICKDPQLYIDKLGQAILENAVLGAKPRYFAKKQANINLDDFADTSKSIIEVEGGELDANIKVIDHPKLDGIYFQVLEQKINELKETSSNRDFSSGSSQGGVTAAAAIAALQEAGNKTSRDMIAASYRSYTKVCEMCIELIRQFYDEARSFRITGEVGYDFVEYSNQNIREQEIQSAIPGGDPYTRRPVFDIKVRAQRKNPFSRNVQNQMAQELYQMGFFNPEMADQALTALELMDFEGKDKVKERVTQGQTLLDIVQQQQAQIQQLLMMMGQAPAMPAGAPQSAGGQSGGAVSVGGGDTLASASAEAQTPNMTSYGERLAQNARPQV